MDYDFGIVDKLVEKFDISNETKEFLEEYGIFILIFFAGIILILLISTEKTAMEKMMAMKQKKLQMKQSQQQQSASQPQQFSFNFAQPSRPPPQFQRQQAPQYQQRRSPRQPSRRR